ncbi:DTW domain-containing protein [Enterovibrio sp. ZSDZ35]|uniref:tRNA-uridine aminocarboxypropyltransferase n=1 Tax=Enterovibrio qingdaonensis TaxID=2899818 RepID=A0ABT5QLX7_9GAMM|nr:DTW domain-containing protein [Enterovibrio sp. ZSDZ35]MDD1781985.1 DTW domain-containing protein [Enterovibrio sp. ZSDZ35]
MRTKPEPCPQCGFHYNCLCDHAPSLSSNVRIELLMHETETDRATNTGQLLEKALPQCRRHIWHRKAPPVELLTLLADPAAEPYLVFPGETAISLDTAVRRTTSKPEAKPIHFIIIDATWQQARKMLRKSPWLEDVPTVCLPDNLTTAYQLRRNQPDGGLCTCEVGILLLEAMKETDNALAMTNYFHQFMQVFEADRQHQSLSQ